MLFTESVFVGIDPTSGRNSFTYAALDRNQNLLALADGEMEEVMAFLGGQRAVTVAVNAPSGVNRGLVREKMQKESLVTGHQIRGADMRLSEYELRGRGITISGTPSREELCPGWMQMGFELYRRLGKMGFKPYPASDSAFQWIETHPHACFCVLLGHTPLPKPTLEGRLQRQLVLHERKMGVKDPMVFFEEITRYKLLKGILSMEMIYLPEALDALVAAYAAWLAMNHPEEVMSMGDQREGRIVLPVNTLKPRYEFPGYYP